MNTPRIEELVEELRDFFDTTLKPKKVTMKNLERELLVDFVRKAHQAGIDEEKNRIWSALCDLAEPDERQIGAGDLKTHLDDVHKIIFITKP